MTAGEPPIVQPAVSLGRPMILAMGKAGEASWIDPTEGLFRALAMAMVGDLDAAGRELTEAQIVALEAEVQVLYNKAKEKSGYIGEVVTAEERGVFRDWLFERGQRVCDFAGDDDE